MIDKANQMVLHYMPEMIQMKALVKDSKRICYKPLSFQDVQYKSLSKFNANRNKVYYPKLLENNIIDAKLLIGCLILFSKGNR